MPEGAKTIWSWHSEQCHHRVSRLYVLVNAPARVFYMEIIGRGKVQVGQWHVARGEAECYMSFEYEQIQCIKWFVVEFCSRRIDGRILDLDFVPEQFSCKIDSPTVFAAI